MLRSIVRRTPELQVKLRNLVKSERVVLFMKGTPEAPQCGFSRKVIQAMHSIHFDDFTYVDVIKSEAVREAVKEYSEWPTIPQIEAMSAIPFMNFCCCLSMVNSWAVATSCWPCTRPESSRSC
eukprot:GEMP01065195.1.p1 GENE.GEMP01065195.1~~GEMP01065195.1.p1  ORF type:complete len:130 (+),score=11.14 GEMP01065195.1:23-391(+)